MNTHAEFFCFFRRRNQKSSHLQENQSPNIIELLRFTSFPTQLRQPVTVTMTLSLLLWCTFGFSSATESLNSTDTCTTRHPLQGSLFLPLVGRSSPPGLIVIEARFSQQFFSALLSSWFLPFPWPLPCTATSSFDQTVSSSPAVLECRLCPLEACFPYISWSIFPLSFTASHSMRINSGARIWTPTTADGEPATGIRA